MKYFGKIGLLVFVIMVSSCNYMKNVRLLTGGSLERENFVEIVPFELKKGLVVVQARINSDSEPREFIFDTGAFDGKIEKSLADSLGLPSLANKTNSTAQGISRTINLTRIDSFYLGNTPFIKTSSGKLDYAASSASRCLAPHGLIGANLIKLAQWKIDFRNRQLSFSDSPIALSDNEQTYEIPFSHHLLSGSPEIEIQVEGKAITPVLFDVGFNGGLVLPKYLSRHFPTTDSTVIIDRATSGIFGSNTDTLIEKTLLVNVGGFETTIPVEFSSIGKSLLGTEFLKNFDVYLDYQKDVIQLQRNTSDQFEMAPNKSFIPGVLNDSLWVVDRVTSDLPIQIGDTLRSVNGKKPSDLYHDFCDYILGIGVLMDHKEWVVETISGDTLRVANFTEGH